jgi:hypothetical protein
LAAPHENVVFIGVSVLIQQSSRMLDGCHYHHGQQAAFIPASRVGQFLIEIQPAMGTESVFLRQAFFKPLAAAWTLEKEGHAVTAHQQIESNRAGG